MKLAERISGLAPFIIIGWRNIWRQKRRSLVVISSIAVGIAAMIMLSGFMNGLTGQMVDNTINTALGHIAIHAKGFRKNIKLEKSFVPDPGMYAAIGRERAVTAWAPRLTIKGMLRSGEGSRGVLIQGIDPAREKGVSRIYDYTLTKQGGFISGPSADEVLISRSLAEKLDVYLDDRVVLMFQDANNEVVGAGLRVCGFFETPMGGFDRGVVFVGIDKLRELAGAGTAVSEIIMSTRDLNEVAAAGRRLSAAIRRPGLEVQTWMDMAPELVSAITLQETMMFVIFLIVFVTVVFSVANTLIMSIIERFHELGVMKSIGTRPSRIFFIVMYEAMSLGLMGLALGIAVSVPVVLVLGHTGMDFSFALDSMRKWGTGSVVYPILAPRDIASAALIVFITAFIAALYPAIKAARIKPLDALNYI